MPDNQLSPEFDRVEFPIDKDITDMTPLLVYLDGPDNTEATAEENANGLHYNSRDTALFVHEGQLVPGDNTTSRILSMAIANRVWLPSLEGWVDDVVTHEDAGRRGLGRAAMLALQKWFEDNGVEIIRLTTSTNHDTASKLYESLGYTEDKTATIWRSYLNQDNMSREYIAPDITPKLLQGVHELNYGVGSWTRENGDALYRQAYKAATSDTSQVIVGRSRQGEVTRAAVAADCRIMSGEGHKAWLYGIKAATTEERIRVIKDSHRVLRRAGALSVNVMTFDRPEDQELIPALEATGYQKRATRLFTLDLSQVKDQAA